jgi:hypothetical protein
MVLIYFRGKSQFKIRLKTEEQAFKQIEEFKGSNLNEIIGKLKGDLIGKTKSQILILEDLYKSALIVKKISSQIDEIVHASGIINCLAKILEPNERIQKLSLASGSDGARFDLETSNRIAEFKFARWQKKSANGSRKRQVFADLVNMFLFQTERKKELYVLDADRVVKYFKSNRSKWKNVLSKSGGLEKRLSEYLLKNSIKGETLFDVFSISGVTIIDIDSILE